MYLATFAARAKSVPDAERICRLFRQSLQLRQEPGFVQGLCTVSVEEPRLIFVVEQWGNLPSLRAWLDSAAHQQLVEQLKSLIEGPLEITLYEERA